MYAGIRRVAAHAFMTLYSWSTSPAVVATISAAIALVTTLLSAPLRYYVDKRTLRHQLQSQYEHEQRRELKQLIGRYHGRLVEAADDWRHRMNNLYKYEGEARLDARGRYEQLDYYFATTAYRFLVLASLARRFEAEAFFFDARIAEKRALDFVKFVKAFRWMMTDLELVEGIEYDAWAGRDHFFTDRFRTICDSFCTDGDVLSWDEFQQRAGKDPHLDEVLAYFDGLRADEDRLRWDRIVCLHLLTMTFLNMEGYDIQRSSEDDLGSAARMLRHPRVLRNLANGFARFCLAEQPEVQRLVGVLTQPPPAESTPAGVPDAAPAGHATVLRKRAAQPGASPLRPNEK